MLNSPGFLVLILAGLGACLGLLTAALIKRARLNSAHSHRSLAAMALDNSTDLVWINHEGKTLWHSRNCEGVLAKGSDGAMDLSALGLEPDALTTSSVVRGVVTIGGRERYFDLSQKQVQGLSIFYAKPAEAAVRAESELQQFMQTLTDTFAHLPIGLAIFDQSRQLVLFNPALAEQFELQPEWLVRRPSLRSVLDRLRNDGKLPEPKDFKDWRNRIEALEKSAETGTFQEDWHLPNGQVYRVIGRPHPKNSVAFLFEDISRTVAIEREYQVELEQILNAFDALSSANVIFDANGQAQFCNQAFAELWGQEAAERLSGLSTTEMTRIWQEKCEPTPVWGDFRDFAGEFGTRSHWTSVVHLLDGTPLWASFSPIPGGHILCEFTPLEKTEAHEPMRLKQSA